MTIKSEIDQDEIYLRWQHFKTIDQLKQEIVARTPHKFDIGAIYNIPISEKEISPLGFKPVQRELVFDIDMDDYSPVVVSGLLFRRFAIAARERISAQNAGVL